MASDLISRAALVDKSEILYQHTASGKIIPWSAVRVCAINNTPAVDAVPVVRCQDCENFWEYTEEHKATVENADGDCAIRKWRSDDEQFCAVTKDDYCSLARRKKDAVD